MFDTFDSRPPTANADRNDVGVVLSFGWTVLASAPQSFERARSRLNVERPSASDQKRTLTPPFKLNWFEESARCRPDEQPQLRIAPVAGRIQT